MKDTSPRSHTVIVNVSGGLVQDVFSSTKNIQILVVDWDQEDVTDDDFRGDHSLTKIGGAVVRTYAPIIDRLETIGEDIRQAVQRTLGDPTNTDMDSAGPPP